MISTRIPGAPTFPNWKRGGYYFGEDEKGGHYKYRGSGSDALARFSEPVGQLEVAERAIAELLSHVGPKRDRLNELKKDTQDQLQELIRELTEIGRGPDAVSN